MHLPKENIHHYHAVFILGTFVTAIGLFVLIGWAFSIPHLKSVVPHWPTMKICTAMGFILCGASLILIINSKSIKKFLINLFSSLVIFVGLITIVDHFIKLNFYHQPLILNEQVLIPVEQMPFIDAINFVLIGIIFLMINFKIKKASVLFYSLIFIVLVNSSLALIGYVYPLNEIYSTASSPKIAFHTALTFVLLTIGILFLAPDIGVLSYFNRRVLTDESFRKILEATPDAIVIMDQTGKIIFINEQTEKLFGYRKNELIHQYVEILIPKSYRYKHSEQRDNFFQKLKCLPIGTGMELYGLRKNQDVFPIEITLSPFETNEGVVGLAAIRDVTDRKNFEKALKEKTTELENALFVKDRFLASMSHELRTPLNAIIGFTGTLLMKLPGDLTHEQEKQLDIIKRSAKHLLSLINDLLDLAKIDSGKIELNFERINCNEIILETYSSLLQLATDKNLQLELDLPEKEIILRTDKRFLTQIIINLVSNAIKFTEVGVVHIKVNKIKRGKKSLVIIQIIDTGPGIQAEDKEKLFQAFQQINIPGKRIEGTGLGLHLSQKLAQLIHGRIHIQSEVGTGSIFSIELPLGE